MKRFSLRFTGATALMVILITIVWDWFFYARPYSEPAGCVLGFFILLLAVCLLLKKSGARASRPSLWVGIAMLGLVFALFLEANWFNLSIALIGLVLFALTFGRSSLPSADILMRLFTAFTDSWFKRPLRDLKYVPRLPLAKRGLLTPLVSFGRLWGIPAAGFLLFLTLFAMANPIIDEATGALLQHITQFFSGITPARAVLWLLVAYCAWGLLRARAHAKARSANRARLGGTFNNADMVVRALVLFNLVFAMETFLDCIYLVGGKALPEDMSYATYAHRGAYPLIFTALLAGIFVLLTFSEHSAAGKLRKARVLVYLWIAQNVLLLFSVVWRLSLYVEAYLLTLLRLASFVWAALVLTGFVLIVVRIVFKLSNRWLLNANASIAAAALYCCCFVDFSAIVAWYNVRHSYDATGQGPRVDYSYLCHLGSNAIPAVNWLYQQNGQLYYRCASWATIPRRVTQWRSRTLRDIRVYNEHLAFIEQINAKLRSHHRRRRNVH